MRPTLYGSKHGISAGHYLAASAGFAILEAGGNAFDAGCCAGIALGVLHPEEVNFAGVAPMLLRTADGKMTSIAGLGHWPGNIPLDFFMKNFGGGMPEGIHRTVVPAAPDAWITALKDYGTMSFGEVAQAAIEFARDGFSVFPLMEVELYKRSKDNARWPGNDALFNAKGRTPKLGERFVQSDLAATIQYMVDEERAHAGKGRKEALEAARRAFYVGDIAQKIVKFHREEGGFLSHDDLANFHSRYEPVVTHRWRDFEINTCGPWCQGPMLIEALLLIERAGLQGKAHNSPDYIHTVIECMKCALADREKYFTDPRFADVPLDKLFSDARIAAWVDSIDPARAAIDMVYPEGEPQTGLAKNHGLPHRDPDTSYVCVVDRCGNVMSATPSDESSKSPVIPGLGICPSSRGTQSRGDPSHPSGFAPGKRPRLTPNPALALRDDGTMVPFGCPGGDSQVQSMAQVFLNVFHFGMDVQAAIDAPRVRSWNAPSSFSPHETYPGLITAEGRIPDDVLTDLLMRGHKIQRVANYTRDMAGVDMIVAEKGGFIRAGADPRQPAYAIVR